MKFILPVKEDEEKRNEVYDLLRSGEKEKLEKGFELAIERNIDIRNGINTIRMLLAKVSAPFELKEQWSFRVQKEKLAMLDFLTEFLTYFDRLAPWIDWNGQDGSDYIFTRQEIIVGEVEESSENLDQFSTLSAAIYHFKGEYPIDLFPDLDTLGQSKQKELFENAWGDVEELFQPQQQKNVKTELGKFVFGYEARPPAHDRFEMIYGKVIKQGPIYPVVSEQGWFSAQKIPYCYRLKERFEK